MAELPASSYPALQAEIAGDPKALGLTAMTNLAVAAKLNEVGASSETLADRKAIPAWEVMNAIDTAEWEVRHPLLSTAQRAWFDDLVAGGMVDVSNARVRVGLGAIFTAAAAPNTRAAMLALRERSCSRAEALFGAGVVIGYYDVDRARAL